MNQKTSIRLFSFIRAIVVALGVFAWTPAAMAQADAERIPLDQLFLSLKSAPDQITANSIATQIWQHWFSPDDPELAERMLDIVATRAAFNTSRTMELLDKLIADRPDYAEGWNRRATLHFEMGNYEESLADIAETLAREPRHFGALSGQALVYLALGDTENARRAVEAAREVHPFIAANPPLSDLVEPRLRV